MTDPSIGFDIHDPQLPKAIKEAAMGSGGFPYESKLEGKVYEERLLALQTQLVLLQTHLMTSGERIVLVFEGRDAAGKGGAIAAYTEYLNPRLYNDVALPKPSDRESTQWYFQRYAEWLPAAKETVLFDRSWYNRAGVERVMGFATPEQVEHFLAEAPLFEQMITNDGIHFFKFWLDIGHEMQLKRLHDRQHDPLKSWKLTSIDYEALPRWHDYSIARNEMLAATDTPHAPWTVILANDKRRARLAVIGKVLASLDYAGKDTAAVGELDPAIVLSAQEFLARPEKR